MDSDKDENHESRHDREPEERFRKRIDKQEAEETERLDTITHFKTISGPPTEESRGILKIGEPIYGEFPPFLDELTSLEPDEESSHRKDKIAHVTDSEHPDYTEEEAFIIANASILYLRGVMDHERMNLDDAISNLTRCFEMAVETDNSEYMVKSQVQLASVHIKRYQLHDHKEDYELALKYTENLIQIGEEQELHDLQIESLILRAMLRKMARDPQGAKEDLMDAGKIAKKIDHTEYEFIIKAELKEVKRLIAKAARMRRLGGEDDEQLMKEAIEKMPAVINGVLRIGYTRKPHVDSVKLYRLVIMDRAAGLPLFSYDFEDSSEIEEFLVFGLLSALSHLSSEVSPDAGRMMTLSHEGQTVMMEHRDKYMGALFASKESFRARQSLEKFLRDYLRSFPDMTGSGQVLGKEGKEAATRLLLRTFRAFLANQE